MTPGIICKTLKGLIPLFLKHQSCVLLNNNKNRPQEENGDHSRCDLEGLVQQKRANADYCNCSWHVGHGSCLMLEEGHTLGQNGKTQQSFSCSNNCRTASCCMSLTPQCSCVISRRLREAGMVHLILRRKTNDLDDIWGQHKMKSFK